jgi:hypothetical protein
MSQAKRFRIASLSPRKRGKITYFQWQRQMMLPLMAALLTAAGVNSSFASGGGHGESSALADRDIGPPSESGVRGVKLGAFRIRIYYPAEARRSAISFLAYATVKEENLPGFSELFAHRRNRIRDQVIVATRCVPLADFDDPDLRSFRRRILLRLRRMMPELIIEDIYMSDFQLDVDSI